MYTSASVRFSFVVFASWAIAGLFLAHTRAPEAAQEAKVVLFS